MMCSPGSGSFENENITLKKSINIVYMEIWPPCEISQPSVVGDACSGEEHGFIFRVHVVLSSTT